ncbi:MAG: galactose mutarotase [Eubacterium sp.]|nr:galactose mutarotase [Eubacterium sp.]
MRQSFGKIADGREAGLFRISAGRDLTAWVTDYGAALVRLIFKDKDGVYRDLVLGYDDAASYERGTESFGGTVGRVANRIGQGRFSLGGRTWQLTTNNGPNTLHGGRDFYVHRLWELDSESDSSVSFRLDSPDGDQGFPGNVCIKLTYRVTEDDQLLIEYHAQSDADTPINLTNHSYFNLGGHDSGSVLDQIVSIQADSMTETDHNSLPTGELLDLEGTPMDFRQPKALGRDIREDYEPLHIGNGYDHNYVIGGYDCSGENNVYREAASLYCKSTGIKMKVCTDLPGLQLYTANYVNEEPGKGGVVYQSRAAVCFETQFFPDAINHENFPGGLLKAGEEFVTRTGYRFSVE